MIILLQTYLLAVTSSLYLLRGMLELPELGWRPEVKLTVFVGVIVLPVLVGLSSANLDWGRWVIIVLSVFGCGVNITLLIRLWRGINSVAVLTIAISIVYIAIAGLGCLARQPTRAEALVAATTGEVRS